ncbi:sugar transferase [Endozoicomonas gorgoniicola]|uniref:Sugar transferase n=1 Tax=Endozoicomonas gorgoniicola TaxID=1234144 RepID=A0ABT3MSQ5_9GAMM|nr:sugar transferase [Endozoicomonas gorgoniicola]MCW7552412.1 sugar transferase [Endozoicomonas gorgoniicola]
MPHIETEKRHVFDCNEKNINRSLIKKSVRKKTHKQKVEHKPKAVFGESGHFVSVEYFLESEEVSSADEEKVWTYDKYDCSEVLYIYTPKTNIALLRHVLEENKINYVINDYSIKDKYLKNKTVCHYRAGELKVRQKEFIVKQIKYGVKVTSLIEALENKLGYTEVSLLNSDFYFDDKSFSVLRRKHHRIPKRFIDIALVCLLAPIAIPIGFITAFFIKIESPGSVLFKQKRTGLYNSEFEVIKFRSMRKDAEKTGARWASENDNRVTKVGKFIRKTRIDELPQLINVLKGEMSMVGPRPEREVFIEKLEKEIPYYRFRHAVRPGVTGLAQVEYPYGASVQDAVWKHKYDMYYIKHQSFWLDVKILAKTVTTVLFGKGL